MTYPTLLSVFGNNLLTAAFLLIGPVPFLDGVISCSLHYEYGVVILFGTGYALVMVSTFGRAIKGVVGIGFNQDDMSTQLMITGSIQIFYVPKTLRGDLFRERKGFKNSP